MPMPTAHPAEVAPLHWTATRLQCQYATNPLGIDSEQPTLGWVPLRSEPGDVVAHQVLVATSPEDLNDTSLVLWDTGRVEADDIHETSYAGPTLRSGQRYWWTVRLWDSDGTPGPWATPAWFETGPMRADDWVGAWISGTAGHSSPLLRRTFTPSAPIASARVHVSALGYYEVRINGERVGDQVLDPATTTYADDPALVDSAGKPASIATPRVLYSSYDVTDLLDAGTNCIGVVLGHGWYSAEEDNGPGPFPRTPYADRPAVLLQLELRTVDGETSVVTTNDSWRTSAGPIRYNDYAQGETYDATEEQPGWDTAAFDAHTWDRAEAAVSPTVTPRRQAVEPTRVIETLTPAATWRTASGATIVDFGQHFSGWTRIVATGPRGAQVRLRHAGEVSGDGELDDDANMGGWLKARQNDTYILAGDRLEHWEPRFTLHGFRYVEVSVSDPEVVLHQMRGQVVHSDLARTGEFECSDPMLNRIHRNVLWSLRSSFQGFPQDAADRAERVGWVGDPGWAIEDYLYDFDARSFWMKWLDDLADTQLATGEFPTICPIHWRGAVPVDQTEWEAPEDQEVPELPTWPYANLPDFSMTSFPSIVWSLYQFYDDRPLLERHYAAMRRGVEYLRSRSEGHILSDGLGDHMEPQPDGTCSVTPRRTPVALTSTTWYYAVVTILLESARVLDIRDDVDEYGRLATAIKDAFNEKFLDTERHIYDEGSQTALALPLLHDLVPESLHERLAQSLVERISDVHSDHLDTGTMGTAALQHVLPDIGAAELMYRMATQPTNPSWAHQVLHGATTVWETWGGDATFSRNMKLLATISCFLYKDVAGLAPTSPGWRTIRVRPLLTGPLTHARARVRTPRGEAGVEWRTDEHGLSITVDVPATTTAQVLVPLPGNGAERAELVVDDKRRDFDAELNHAAVDLGGGRHHVRLRTNHD